VSSRFAESWV